MHTELAPCLLVLLSRQQFVIKIQQFKGLVFSGELLLFIGYRVFFWKDEKFWGWIIGMVAYLMLLNCILKNGLNGNLCVVCISPQF